MRILICHGYLLRGTGSNQYVQSLARALCQQGHHLAVMCQEDDPRLDFVSAYLREEEGSLTPHTVWEKKTDYPGNCMVFKPEIGGLLPVYVLDSYPGFTVKEFTALDEIELDWYVDRNRRSLDRLVEQFVPEVLHVNHAVMLPYIARPVAAKYDIPYFVSIHGSAIDFTVRKDSRYLPYGIDGLEGAKKIFVPSEHTEEQVIEVFGPALRGLEEKLTLLPPGVDTELFKPGETDLRESVDTMMIGVRERSAGVRVGNFWSRSLEAREPRGALQRLGDEIARINSLHPEWMPDPELGVGMEWLVRRKSPFIMFLGKLLETKGIQCAIPAFPLVIREYPDARLVVVGFGELRGLLEMMIAALDDGEIGTFRRLCEYGNETYVDRMDDPFGPVLTFLEDLSGLGMLDDYVRVCYEYDLRDAIIFTGYLTPEEHRNLLPHARALLVPSLAQEAFGMVVTEAMASGVLPIASYHSGLETALEPMRTVWGSRAEQVMLGTREKVVSRIAEACNTVLGMPEAALALMGVEMRSIVKKCFSWEAAARRIVEYFEEASRNNR
ncbi:MAG TPA: glycosyltransferase family 4 protein [Candidatus Anoxymicrobiaceae bacterium]